MLFNDMFFHLSLYKFSHGHCDVPEEYTGPDGLPLGYWVQEQRSYFNGRNTFKADWELERVASLVSIGFDFKVLDEKWNKSFEELVKYREENPDRWPTQGSGLGSFVRHHRAEHASLAAAREELRQVREGGAGGLPSERALRCFMRLSDRRVRKLDGIGFVWRAGKETTTWDDTLEQLREYKRVHGDCVVPQHYGENRHLGEWVTRMRYQYGLRSKGRKNQLTDERVRVLDEMGFQWTCKGQKRKKLDKAEEQGEEEPADGQAGAGVGRDGLSVDLQGTKEEQIG